MAALCFTFARRSRGSWPIAVLVALLSGVFMLMAGATAASAEQHPSIDFDTLKMVPEQGWGVADQTPLETQTPSLEVLVWDMVQSGDRMFVAGGFLNVQNGEGGAKSPQPYLAAFDVDTGEWVETFRPEFDRIVYALAVLPNGSLLVGGEFENVNGTPRKGLVAIDEITGAIDPSFAGQVDRRFSANRAMVRDIEIEDSGQVYVAGNFSHLVGNGGAEAFVAKAGRFSDVTGTPDRVWRPQIGGAGVWGLDVEPSLGEVALSGYFSLVNGELNSGYFHVVDDVTGATVPGKIDIEPNDWGRDPEVFDVVYGDGVLFHIGEQHMLRVLDPADHTLLGYHHTGIANDGFYEIGRFAGGAYQGGDLIGDVLISGCHCTFGLDNHYSSFDGARVTRKNVMAYDAATGEHLEAFNADVDALFDGHWAAASDTNGCLWLGGDYHLGGASVGQPFWLGGFARLCSDLPPLQIVEPEPGVLTGPVDEATSFAFSVVDDQNAALVWSAQGLPEGLSIDSSTGVVSGVATVPGLREVTVTVEAVGQSATGSSLSVTWIVLDQVAPEVVALGDRVVNKYAKVEMFLSATDSEGSAMTWSATGLPAGLDLHAASGTISGVVPEAGIYTVEVTATDPVGLSDSASFSLTVLERASANMVTSDPALVSTIAPTVFDPIDITTFGGYAFTVDQPQTVSELGVFDDAATWDATVVLYDDTHREMARVEIPNGSAPVEGFRWVALAEPVQLEPGVEYVVVTELGIRPSFEAASATLLDGVTVTRLVAGPGPIVAWPTLERPADDGAIGPSLRFLAIDPTPQLAKIADQVSAVGQTFSVAPEAVALGANPLTWSAVGLPSGMSLDSSTGLISGTTDLVGRYRVVVSVVAPTGLFASEAFDWRVFDIRPPAVSALPDRSVTQYESFELTAELDEARIVQWSAVGLPAGLSIDEDSGSIAGNALEDGVFTVTVVATDPDRLFGTTSFELTVAGRATESAMIANADPQLKVGDNLVGYVFNVDTEMELAEVGVYDADQDGQIANVSETTVVLFDNTTQDELARATVAPDAAIEDGFAWAPLLDRYVLQPGTDYVVAVTLSGEPWTEWGDTEFIDGFNPIASAFIGDDLVQFPSRQSTFNGRNIGPGLRIIVGDTPPEIVTPSDVVLFVDTPTSVQLEASVADGATAAWTIAGLPSGLTLDPASGLISGTPTVLGDFDVVATVTDSQGLSTSAPFELTVRPIPIAPVIDPLADLRLRQYGAVDIQPLADSASLLWSAVGLPASVSIDQGTGQLAGTATEAGVFAVTVTAINADQLSSSQGFTLTVDAQKTMNVVESNTSYQTKLGNNFLGYVFEVDREMTVVELGVHDTNRDGAITNDGDTTIILYDNATEIELARLDVPAGVAVDAEHYGWQPLSQPVVLSPGVQYALAGEASGEPWSEWGRVSFVEGVTAVNAAFKGGSEPGFPLRQRPFNGRHFGPSMRVIDDRPAPPEPPAVLLSEGSEWRFDDSDVNPGSDWMTPTFDDSEWRLGSAEFGFGEVGQNTTWTSGAATYYVRTDFTVTESLPPSLRLNLKADDGAVVYLNGVEVLRVNIDNGVVTHNTQANRAVYGAEEAFQTYDIPGTSLVLGSNTIAVSVHNVWRGSADLSFDLGIETLDAAVDPGDGDGGEKEVGPVELVPASSVWSFTDSMTEGGDPVNWKQGLIDRPTGIASFGFGQGVEVTTLAAGSRAYYFTKEFDVADPAAISGLELGLTADDGAVVYLNGVEIHRTNMPEGPVDYLTAPISWASGADELRKVTTIGPDALVAGTNVIAVEVHNIWRGNGDLAFGLDLTAS